MLCLLTNEEDTVKEYPESPLLVAIPYMTEKELLELIPEND